MLESLTFVNAVLFLIGIILMVAGSFPYVRERSPKLFLNGFLVTLAGLVSMLITAFALTPKV